MNANHVKGGVNDVKGRVKEEVGHAVGNDTLAGEGVLDQVKGKIQSTLGDVKDAVKGAVDRVLHSDEKKESA